MNPKEKAAELIDKFQNIIIDNYTNHLENAKKCALLTVDEISKIRPGYPYPDDVGVKSDGIYSIIHYPDKYWREVYEEIIKYYG